jgi:hypothetical protein
MNRTFLEPAATVVRSMRIGVLLLLALACCTMSSSAQAPGQAAAPAAVPAPDPSGKHTVTVTFNYDFSRTPSCSAKVTKHCIRQFNVYDVSAGTKKRVKLFSIEATPGETKAVPGIKGTSPLMAFEPGKHKLAVTAQDVNGKESNVDADTTWVTVPPPAAATKPAPPSN